ncbi:MAG: 4-deoxy-4-formamido-L-arabinose-phosphoundecaprenol deformylase [Desulfobulbaceae bacterium]|nr:4-deoxy-4-formamido-L-arabinose-phosphoundecaprenol deformylase [Desulfobulbaceae bacterium]
MRIALKVDIDTLRGTEEGVPNLLRLFDRHQVRATFLFSLGPDHTGRALRRVFRPGFLAKVRRTSVTSHYGLKTLLYGTLLPGPHIGRRCGAIMRQVRAAGHEVGIHCYDHFKWQDYVAGKDAEWTRRELTKAITAFGEVFGEAPRVLGAPGWQLNGPTLALEEELGFRYASDCRGEEPFLPELAGVSGQCPQLPTTLPTLDELLGLEGINEGNVHEQVFQASRRPLPQGHLYTLHGELEGMKLAPVLERLLSAWNKADDQIGPLADTFASLDVSQLPRRQIAMQEIPGRSGLIGVAQP